ncbi:MAG: 5'/3'-nucleotidase SurE [Chloroflexi bacterium]|nr:5'/3'-nucleotidase SurE [Chloroflexota bacterium]
MKIMVTNDDGAHAPGLWALVRALRPVGSVVVCAPDRDRSGVGPALSVNELIRAKKVVSALPDVTVYAVEGTPGDAAVLGLRKLVGEPVDVVVSGINPGTNVGEDVIISGTIGAGIHAYMNGVPTLAVSVGGETEPDHPVVEAVTREVVRAMAEDRSPVFVNLNFPDLARAPARGALRTTVASRFLKDGVDSLQRGYRTYYWVLRRGGRSVDSTSSDTDVWAVRNGYVSLSAIHPEFARGDVAARLSALVEAAAKALQAGHLI